MPDQIFTDNGDGDTRGTDVLLSAGIDDSVLGNINGLGDEIGAHVADEDLVADIGDALNRRNMGQMIITAW